jgi:predicted NodU family carbamoyl transferase
MSRNFTVLGINGGVRLGYQDVSAVLMRDGIVIAAVEEERLSRVKFSAGQLPLKAIKEVLDIAGLNIHEIDVVAFHGLTWGDEILSVLNRHFDVHFGFVPVIKRYHHHDCHAPYDVPAHALVEVHTPTIPSSRLFKSRFPGILNLGR